MQRPIFEGGRCEMKKLNLKCVELTETDIKHQIRDYLRARNIFNFPILQTLGTYKGAPDRIIFFKGKTICCEIKKPSGVQSEYQKQFQVDVERSGGIYIIAKSLDDVISALSRVESGL